MRRLRAVRRGYLRRRPQLRGTCPDGYLRVFFAPDALLEVGAAVPDNSHIVDKIVQALLLDPFSEPAFIQVNVDVPPFAA